MEELTFLQEMTPLERELHYIHEEARHEQAKMDKLMDEYKWLGKEVQLLSGKQAAVFSAYRRRVRQEIREAGDNIRWLRVQYRKTSQQGRGDMSNEP